MARGLPWARGMPIADRFSVLSWMCWPLVATVVFWMCFGTCVAACVDAPLADTPPQARVILMWDPLQCGEPHRVVVELEDDGGAPLRASGPCALGGLTIDVAHFGIWRGRIYSWVAGEMERSIVNVTLAVDEPIVRWIVDTPQ